MAECGDQDLGHTFRLRFRVQGLGFRVFRLRSM